ncbi:hypothetical protein NLC26_00025 [Candidatus Aminicenantes bacterium AC-708-M15]|nr:hypothetical protein [SCandidatus Aminicenantes bacterium Aminicenantia_JdfR_composite]MCP2597405.1 hypothetical protein [Candidatus Aminicenantes bacterium AC-335-G13]MCP2598163.1 hypothetical protein [Candidatus Aminicenantes bacterium AC-335-L06]MCP2598903.1 hypothetical protein [Candidatus Aminicenantes bacterium AC-335-B20]MCP2603848.1 hypothetical protein [Candidatus Aminicenantes bacterium AC-708-M15]MCP2605628.1 hypothetical protein [Candidatus Aminicenantes bacterium AC-335-O07]MC
MNEKIAIIFNPGAGRGKATKEREKLEALLKKYEISYNLFVSKDLENIRELVKDKSKNYKIIVGAGGDSTFQIIVDEIIRNNLNNVFGLIALGSSNDIAKDLNLDTLEKACLALKRMRIKKIDVGYVKKGSEIISFFIGQANIGLGVFVNKYVEELASKSPFFGKRQILAGTLGIINSYLSKKIPVSLNIKTDDKETHGLFLLAVISNIKYWATRKKINPHALIDDGKLDCCLIEYCGFPRLLQITVSATRGEHIKAKEVSIIQSSSFKVSSEIPFEIQVDGEILGGYEKPLKFNDISINVLPKTLSLIC